MRLPLRSRYRSRYLSVFFTLHSSLFTLIVVMILSVALVGCKTKEYVPVVEHHTDTLRLVQHHRDSIYLHDSTFVKEYIQGDTIYVERSVWHTDIRERVKTDTVYKSKTDSVPVPYPVIKEVEKKLSKMQKGLMGIGVLSLLGLLAFAGFKMKKLLP